MIEFALQLFLWLVGAAAVLGGAGILLCWLCFGYAALRGELHDGRTPADILAGTNKEAP